MTPSAQQQAVLDWVDNASGSLNLIARAGCGKTSTLLMLVEHLCRKHHDASIFLGAFNKKIAEEISLKLSERNLPITCSTTHSMGFRICRTATPHVRVEERKLDKILTEAAEDNAFVERNYSAIRQAVSLAKQVGFDILNDSRDLGCWHELFDYYDIGSEVTDRDQLAEACFHTLTTSQSLDARLIDFADMIYAPLFHNYTIPQTFRWVAVDEAQDLNYTRRELAFRLLKAGGRLVAVGDDRQAIYGFTGADTDSLEQIRLRLGSQLLPLNVTYRCPKAVVAEAQRYVPDITAHDSAPEGTVLRARLVERAERPDEFSLASLRQSDAVLCRNTAPLVKLAYSCIRRGIPAVVEGRDIGKGLVLLATKWKVVELSKLSAKLSDYMARETTKWINRDRPEKAQQVEDQVTSLLYLIDLLEDEGKHDVDDLVGFISKLFADTKAGERILTFSTIHKSKGREWPRVFFYLPSLIPSRYATHEWQQVQESNLAYVAITRAQDTLIFLS